MYFKLHAYQHQEKCISSEPDCLEKLTLLAISGVFMGVLLSNVLVYATDFR
jgi:hypothetical protein